MAASLENLYIDLGAQWVNSAAKLLPFWMLSTRKGQIFVASEMSLLGI